MSRFAYSQAEIQAGQRILEANVNAFNEISGMQDIRDPALEGIRANNESLTHEAWIRYDDRIVMVARENLQIFNDLNMAGLVFPTNLGNTISRYQRSTDMTEANVSLYGDTEGEMDRVTYDESGVPVPIVHKDWQIDARSLLASQQSGEPLDTTSGERAGRVVAEKIEDLIIKGNFKVGSDQIYGLTNHPKRQTFALNVDWSKANLTEDERKEIVTEDMVGILRLAKNHNYYRNLMVYVSGDIWTNISLDYNDQKGDLTIKQRIENFAQISMVKLADRLPNKTVVLLAMGRDTIDVAMGASVTNSRYQNGNPMMHKFMTWGAVGPRIKYDTEDNIGLVHATYT